MAFLKNACRTSYWLSTINCLVFLRKPRFCVRVLGDRQTDRETSEQDYRVKPPRLNIHLGLDFLLARSMSNSTDLLGLELNILMLGSSLL